MNAMLSEIISVTLNNETKKHFHISQMMLFTSVLCKLHKT